MFDSAENTFRNGRNSVAETDFDISRGVTGFDRKFSLPVCKTEADVLPKKCPNLSANKTARGVLSPIQVADLGLVFA